MPPIMSDYVFPEDQEAPFDYDWGLHLSPDQYIDSAWLDLQALNPSQDFEVSDDQYIDPALPNLHTLDTNQVLPSIGE